jgi:SAM-dependent methyltransferase
MDYAETSPFPPPHLMQIVAGTDSSADFAQHGKDIYQALSGVSPKPLMEFGSILDFGVGCGRLARMFGGFRGRYVGVDIDKRLVEWVAGALPYVHAVATEPNRSIALDEQFEAIISVSVFSHLDDRTHLFYLSELRRLAMPGGYLFLTVHGERALQRAEQSPEMFRLLGIPMSGIAQSRESFTHGNGYNFVLQSDVHLTADNYQYGITFISADYIQNEWAQLFEIVHIASGAIHDFQDIVVLRKL